jgi:RNA polymerase sigma factor (sigma-70 family)
MAHSSLQNVLRFARRMAEAGQGSTSTDAELLKHFSIHNDDLSFAHLVERHGSMVWGVCRRILNHAQDAEDCFQAAFLVLARKAGTLQKDASLGAWLHRVAYRLALRSKATAARRQTEEGRAAAMNPVSCEREESWQELRKLIDQELEHLPQIYRVPLVLCYLEGKSNAEAAKELGWPLGSVKGRLSRGRDLLRKRLQKRGLTLAGAALVALLTERAASAAVPGILLMSTTTAATAFAIGETMSASSQALALANELLRAATLGSLVKLAFVGVALTLTIGSGAMFAEQTFVDESRPQAANTRGQRPTSGANRIPPEHVDLAGDPLPVDAISRLGSTRFSHCGAIRTVQVSSDGKSVIARGADGICQWDIQTGKQLPMPQWKNAQIAGPNASFDASGEGKLFIVAKTQGIDSYSAKTGAKSSTFGMGRYYSVFVSPDGKHLAALSRDEHFPVELFDLTTGKSMWSSGSYQNPMASVSFTSDNMNLVVAGWDMQTSPPRPDNSLRILNAESGAERLAIDLGDSRPAQIAISPDNKLVAVNCQFGVSNAESISNKIRIWDLATGAEKHRIAPPLPASKITGHRSFSSLLFLPNGRRLVTAGNSNELIVWDLTTGKEEKRLGHRVNDASSMALTPNGKTLVVAGGNHFHLIDVATGNDVSNSADSPPNALAAAFMEAGAVVATAGWLGNNGDSRVTFWDPVNGRELRRVLIPEGRVWGLLPRGTSAIVEPWRSPNSLVLTSLEKTTSKVLATKFTGRPLDAHATSVSGKLIAIGDSEQDVVDVFDSQTGATLHSFKDANQSAYKLRFTADEKQLFVFSRDQTVRIWDLDGGKKINQYMLTKVPDTRPSVAPVPATSLDPKWCPPFDVALSPNGKSIASMDYRDYVLICDACDGKNSRRVNLNALPIVLAFSPDSKLLLWASWDEPLIHLMDVTSGHELRRLTGDKGWIISLVFSSNAQRLVSSNTDGTCLVWDFGRIMRSLPR